MIVKKPIPAWWSRLVESCTRPFDTLPSVEDEKLSRALATLFSILFITGVLIYTLFALQEPFGPSHVGASSFLLLSTGLVYFLSRTHYYSWALTLYTLTFTIGSLWRTVNTPQVFLLPLFLLVPILLNSVFLSFRAIVWTTVFTFAVLMSIYSRNAEARLLMTSSYTYYLYLLIALPGIFLSYYRVKLESQRQEQLRESEARLRSYFDEANDWIFMLDTHGCITYANKQISRDSGYTPEQLLGQPVTTFLQAQDAKLAQANLQRIWSGEDVAELSVQIVTLDGRTLWLEARGRTLYENGAICGTLHIARNVTLRKQAELAAQEQHHIAEMLYGSAVALNHSLSPDDILDRVLQSINQMIPCVTTDIMLLEGDIAYIARHASKKAAETETAVFNLRFSIPHTPNLRQMMISRQPQVISDTQQYPGWQFTPGLEWVRSVLSVPLIAKGEIVGFLHISANQPAVYNETHAQRLATFAEHVANALHNAWLYEAEQRRRTLAETLRQSAAVLTATLSLDSVLMRILEQLGRSISFDSASVQQREGEGMVLKAVTGFDTPDDLLNLCIPIAAKFPNYEVIQRGQPVAVPDVVAAYPHFQDEKEKFKSGAIRSWLGIPLLANEEVIGIIAVDRHRVRPFTSDEIAVAQTFAQHATIALQNANLYRQLAQVNLDLETAVATRTAALKQTTDQVEAILNNSPDAILLFNRQLTIDRYNPAAAELFGWEPLQPTAQFAESTLVDARLFTAAIRKIFETGGRFHLELLSRQRTGETHDLEVVLAPLHTDDHISGVLCSFHDITNIKELERIKDAFVSNVSHELRTPIANLKLHHDLMRLNPVKQAVYMERLGREIDRLDKIIESLLQLSRLDQGRVSWQMAPVDLNHLAQQYATDRQPLAQTRQITLQLSETPRLPLVQADTDMLGQAISILLTNALNYTSPNSCVQLATHVRHDNQSSWVGISVSDTGPGISLQEQAHIFERFYRGTAAQESRQPGTGLGLSIAYQIVQHHQGFIEVVSDGLPGTGATFTIWLPLPLGAPANE